MFTAVEQKYKHDRQCTYNTTRRGTGISVVAAEYQYYIL
jgi:hypothetical protein